MTNTDEQHASKGNKDGNGRAAYQSPALTPLGDIRLVTLGASQGADESGMPNTFRR